MWILMLDSRFGTVVKIKVRFHQTATHVATDFILLKQKGFCLEALIFNPDLQYVSGCHMWRKSDAWEKFLQLRQGCCWLLGKL